MNYLKQVKANKFPSKIIRGKFPFHKTPLKLRGKNEIGRKLGCFDFQKKP